MFDPKLESGFGAPSPVQSGTSAIGAIGGLLDGLGVFDAPAAAPAPPSPNDVKAADRSFFFSEWDKGQQLISQGKVQEGNRVIASAYRGWTSKYGTGTDEQVDNAFTMSTGVSPNVSQYGSATDITKIRQTPEFPLYVEQISITNPNASPEQIEQEAIRLTSNKLANDAKLLTYQQSEKVAWVDVERTYQEGANLLYSDVQGIITTIQADDIITPEEAKMAREWYRQNRTKFAPPPGVADEDWSSFQSNRLDPIDEIVELSIGASTTGTMTNDLNRALSQIIDKAIVQGKLPPALRIQLAPDDQGNYNDPIRILQGLSNTGAYGDRWAETVNNVLAMDYNQLLSWVKTFPEQDASFLGNVDTTEFRKLKPSDKINSLEQDRVALGSEDTGKAALAAMNIIEKVASLDSVALTPQLFASTFNDTFYNKLDQIYKTNPTVGEALIGRAQTAMAAQENAILVATESVAAQAGYSIQLNSKGQYDLVPDINLMSPEAAGWIKTYFGGDVAKAFEANGFVDGMPWRSQQMNPIMGLKDKAKKIKNSLGIYSDVLKTRSRLNDIMPDTGNDSLGGSAGADTLGFPSSLIGTESGGNFGAANNVEGAGGTGHFGRLQFSQGRLAEAKTAGVMPRNMTPEDFLKNPEVQKAVETWHFSDIKNFIGSNDLARFVGTVIKGVPVTLDGMLAVAHLGGKGGLKKFLESNGSYNPSDAYGTSLLDYLGTHQGSSVGPAGGPVPTTEPMFGGASSVRPEATVAPQSAQESRTAASVDLATRVAEEPQRLPAEVVEALRGKAKEMIKSMPMDPEVKALIEALIGASDE
jgi:hypothetical protein